MHSAYRVSHTSLYRVAQYTSASEIWAIDPYSVTQTMVNKILMQIEESQSYGQPQSSYVWLESVAYHARLN